MKVLLIDLDLSLSQRTPKFPNLALMKLSAFHKAKGDLLSIQYLSGKPDLIYASCVFSWNAQRASSLPQGTIIGGSGLNLTTCLPPEIEHIMPDYSLYPYIDYSLGFTSRGCIRKCPWCIVPQKEGTIQPWASIYEFWNKQHRKITLLDNNLLASPNWQQTLKDLVLEQVEVEFNQGLDIRLVNTLNATYLQQLNTKKINFAFDAIEYEEAIHRGIQLLLDKGIPPQKLYFFILVGFPNDTTAKKRIAILRHYRVRFRPLPYHLLTAKIR